MVCRSGWRKQFLAPDQGSALGREDQQNQQKTGETEKANKIIERVAVIYSQNLDYYFSFTGLYKDYFKDDIQTSFSVLRRLNLIATQNNQPELARKMDELFNKELKSYK